jgi:hypothetical protein
MMSFFSNALAPASDAIRTAARDVALGFSIFGRGTLGLTGALTLMALLVAFGSERVREQAMAAALALLSPAAAVVPVVVDEPRPQTPKAATWSDWLSAAPATAAEPAQEHVTRYLSRRYRVAESAVRPIVVEAFRIGRLIGVEPMLILAVTAVESGLNPFAQSPVGAQGLMQVMTRVHRERFAPHGGEHAALDPIANLRVGSEILRDLIRQGGSIERGLQLYVGAGNLEDDGGYAARVLGEMARIKVAANGGVREALNAGWRADAADRPAAVPVRGDGPAASMPELRRTT